MKKLFTLLLCLSLLKLIHAQTTFQKTYGGSDDEAMFGLTRTHDGGYLLAGNTESFGAGQPDIFLIKTDADGNEIWSKAYRGNFFENVVEVDETSDHGFIMVGSTTSFGAGSEDAFIIKADSIGNIIWSKVYGGILVEAFHTVTQTYDGGFAAAGYTESFGAGGSDILIVRTDSAGNTLWTRLLGGASFDSGNNIIETSDSSLVLCGQTWSFGSGFIKVFLGKLSAVGDTLWSVQYGGNGQEEAQSVKETFNGDYIIAGSTNSFGSTGYNAYLSRFDTSGNMLWSKIYGGQKTEAMYEVVTMADSGFALMGWTETFGEGHRGNDSANVFLVRTDANGDTLWTHTYGGEKMDEPFGMVKTDDEGLAILAFSNSFGNDSLDVYFIKTDSTGTANCNETFCSPFVIAPPTATSRVNPQVGSGILDAAAPFTVINPAITETVLCFTVGITSTESSSEKFILFPNPATEAINIYLASPLVNATLNIVSVLGQSVLKEDFSGQQHKADVSALNTGIYFFSVADAAGIKVSGKFIKH